MIPSRSIQNPKAPSPLDPVKSLPIRYKITAVYELFLDLISRSNKPDRDYLVLVIANDEDRQFQDHSHRLAQHVDYFLHSYDQVCGIARGKWRKYSHLAPYPVYFYPRQFAVFRLIRIIRYLVRLISRRDTVRPIYINAEKRLWSRILCICRPHVILAICASRELCLAAHSLGITVVDVAHSQITDSDDFYSTAYRSALQPLMNADYYYVWTKEAKNLVSKWHPADQILVGPSPSLQSCHKINTSLLLEDSRPNILISLQFGVNSEYPNHIRPSLLTLMKLTSSDYNWIIRPHPNHLLHDYDVLHDIGCRQLYSTFKLSKECLAISLPSLLQSVDLHITEYSGVICECAYFHIPSIVLDEAHISSNAFYELHSLGLVTYGLPSSDRLRTLSKIRKSQARALEDCPSNGFLKLRKLINVSTNQP